MMLMESPHPVRFNRVYFTIFRAKVSKILIFKWVLLLEIQQIAEIGFGRKNQLSPQLPNLQIFNSENVKNKECFHTQANSIG